MAGDIGGGAGSETNEEEEEGEEPIGAAPIGGSASRLVTPRGRLLLFGGAGLDRAYMQDVYLGDLLSLDPRRGEWEEHGVAGQRPCPRAGHTLTHLPSLDAAVLIGGRTGPLHAAYGRATVRSRGGEEEEAGAAQQAPRPAPKLGRGALFSRGSSDRLTARGWSPARAPARDSWLGSQQRLRVGQVGVVGIAPSPLPSARKGGARAVRRSDCDHERFAPDLVHVLEPLSALFGGEGGLAWRAVRPAGQGPGPLYGHSAVCAARSSEGVIVFGGRGPALHPLSGDLHVLHCGACAAMDAAGPRGAEGRAESRK